MDQIENLVTEVFAIEDTGEQIRLKDKTKHSLGSFFKIKKDGTKTQAFQQFQNMGIKSGSIVEISFKETPDKTKPEIIYKNIIGFRESGGRPIQTATPTQKTPPEPISYATQPFKNGNDAFGRRLALHGFINARLVNNPISQVEIELDQLIKLEDKIDSKLNTGQYDLRQDEPSIESYEN